MIHKLFIKTFSFNQHIRSNKHQLNTYIFICGYLWQMWIVSRFSALAFSRIQQLSIKQIKLAFVALSISKSVNHYLEYPRDFFGVRSNDIAYKYEFNN